MAELREGQRLKYTVTHYRQPHLTHEEFMKWIVDEHLPLAMPVFKKHGVLSYTLARTSHHLHQTLSTNLNGQFVTPASMNEPLKEAMIKLRPTWDYADYDCIIEYLMPSPEAMTNMQQDPGWHASIKDQEKWVDVSRALLTVGYAVPYLTESGEIMNMSK
ncbi:hypothetical protein ZTR_06349 [Talaromyces verruculosus]|nr:hypothetical protein ZTR_06349 [Talaromyces verruculosus]